MNDIPKRHIDALLLSVPRSADTWINSSGVAIESQGASDRQSNGERVYNFTTALFRLLRTWTQRMAERRHLATLNDHLLKDIGLDRHDVLNETRKSFWQS